jgi:spore coat polysaccharide biosynthesis protein SpsF (cytidylyltransferase family)
MLIIKTGSVRKLNINNITIKLDNKPEVYSVSRLKMYSQCSQAYKYTYIDKIKVYSQSNSTIIGSLLHDSLEIYLHSNNSLSFIEVFEEQSKKTFTKRKYILENLEPATFTKLYTQLVDYSRDIRTLHYRASADYTGKNAIRTAKGDVPSNPSMTSGWKQAAKNLNLESRYETLKEQFIFISNLPEIDLVEAFTEAYTLACNYETPVEIIETLHLEFPLSDYNYETKEFTNPVLMPDEYGGESGIYLNGYIDWVGYVQFQGKKRFALIDYKTSKENLTEDKLEYHAQLLAYVYAVERLLGIEVEVIGVHSLRHKKLALTLVDREILQEANRSLFSKHKKIAACQFEKDHLPDSQYSMCLSQYGRECSYLQYCYPKLYNKLHPESLANQLESLLAS